MQRLVICWAEASIAESHGPVNLDGQEGSIHLQRHQLPGRLLSPYDCFSGWKPWGCSEDTLFYRCARRGDYPAYTFHGPAVHYSLPIRTTKSGPHLQLGQHRCGDCSYTAALD